MNLQRATLRLARSQYGAAMVEYTTMGVSLSVVLLTSINLLGQKIDQDAFGEVNNSFGVFCYSPTGDQVTSAALGWFSEVPDGQTCHDENGRPITTN
ncbi:MAG: Flp family type IVb pilin [Bdellovibrionales bacterium]|nr:Flp family type IVb pilin [Bdellovibrionales bacterium]